MNNDRFDDALRRKLEEVNPPFQEKNWTQLRRFMVSRGFPPSVWHSPVQWLQPALTSAAAAGLLLVAVWQYRANQTLNERIETLSKTVTRLEQVQTDLQRTVKRVDEAPRRSDTVYVVPRVPVGVASARPQPERPPGADAYARRPPVAPPGVPDEAPARTESERGTATDAMDVPTNVPTSLASAPARPDRQPRTPPADPAAPRRADAVVGTGQPRNAVTNAPPTLRNGSETTAVRGNQQPQLSQTASPQPTIPQAQSNETTVYATPDAPTSSRTASVPQSQRLRGADRLATQMPGGNAAANTSARNGTPTRPAVGNAANDVAVAVGEPVAAGKSNESATAPVTASARLSRLTPVQTLSQSDGQAEQWQRRLRRVRYRSPVAPPTTTPTVATAKPQKQTHPLHLRWRLGAGADVSTENAGYGVYGEVVVGNRLTIGAGVGPATWAGDSYQTEVQFSERTKRDFRREYPGRVPDYIGPGPGGPTVIRREVLDISRMSRAVVVPLQVGYRLGLGRQWFVTPFAGVNLSINPVETVDFSSRKPFSRDAERRSLIIERPAGAYSSWTLGFGFERTVGPFVAQLSPVASLPITGANGGLNTSSVGLRARVYYQF